MNEQIEGNSVISSQRLLEPKEVAQRLHVSSGFIYKLIRSGQLPAVRLGTAVRIAPADLQEFLETNRTSK